jgi:DNA-binding NarL/FixJ family response regulator
MITFAKIKSTKMINVFIADDFEIVKYGLKVMISSFEDVKVVGEASSSSQMYALLEQHNTDVLLLNYLSSDFKLEDIPIILNKYPHIKIIGVTDLPEKQLLENALKAGIAGHILRCCDTKEVVDAIHATHLGDKFFCGKVLNVIKKEDIDTHIPTCAPVVLSERELEIIGLVAEGLTNKEIADKLFISSHTVMTHRKNIMVKLGVNNTAGIVIYAVKEGLILPNKYLFSPENSF